MHRSYHPVLGVAIVLLALACGISLHAASPAAGAASPGPYASAPPQETAAFAVYDNYGNHERKAGGLSVGRTADTAPLPGEGPGSAPAGTSPTTTPTVCAGTYAYATATGTIEAGQSDTGNHCDDCTVQVGFPFPVLFYNGEFTQADVSSNGNLQFVTGDPGSFNDCLPSLTLEAALMPHWDDLRTDDNSGCPVGGCGIFTSVSGQAPDRVFNVEWRAVRYSNPTMPVNFEIRFHEGRPDFDYVYGQVDAGGADATVGEQNDATLYTQFSCLTPGLSQGLLIQWTLQGCSLATSTPTSTLTPCPNCSATATYTPTFTPSVTPTPTSTPCGLITYTGSITLNDPTQQGRHFRDGVHSTCDAPKECPSIVEIAPRHYDSYTLTNTNADTQCVTVDLYTMCIDIHFIFAAAYLDSFNPDNICENYLADLGSSPYPSAYMSFLVPPNRDVVVVVSEVTTNEGCGSYTLTIRGLGVCGTPTPTVTGTPPTATPTATNTPTPCGYLFTTATATIEPGTVDTNLHCDDCVGAAPLPFPFTLYGEQYDQALISSNGNIQFLTRSANRLNTCLPAPSLSAALLPYWSDLVTDCTDCGVYTSVTGTAPARTFNIEWRAGFFKETGNVNFEVRLHEGTGIFDFVYGEMSEQGFNASVGVQAPDAVTFDQYECNSGGLVNGLLVRGDRATCAALTPTPTGGPSSTETATPTPTRTPCTLSFTDVHANDYFYEAVTYLACHGAISGYSDHTFRPYNSTTRGQLSKIVVLGLGWFIDTRGGPHFSDVPSDNPFYDYIETAYNHQVISGYADGTFRWGNNVTRGQLSKIVVEAMNWDINTSGGPHFTDVPTTDTFYNWIETAYNRGIISGYADSTFRPGNNATRGQIAKIVYGAITAP